MILFTDVVVDAEFTTLFNSLVFTSCQTKPMKIEKNRLLTSINVTWSCVKRVNRS